MEEVMNDTGYQQSLESMIIHKMLIRDLIFKDPVYMTMALCELLADNLRNLGKVEVEYEGSTSILHVKGQFSFMDVTVAMCNALAIAIRTGSSERGIFMQVLVHQLITTAGQDTCSAMNILLDYIKNPTKLHGFFKVFNIANNEFQNLLN